MTQLQLSALGKDGTVVGSENSARDEEVPLPDSIGEQLVQRICQHGKFIGL